MGIAGNDSSTDIAGRHHDKWESIAMIHMDHKRFLLTFAVSLLLVGTRPVLADPPEISDPEGRAPAGSMPGTFPTTVTATNVDIQPIVGSELGGTGSDNLRVRFPAGGPIRWTESRHNEGDVALLIGPRDPDDPQSYPPDSFVNDYRPLESGQPFAPTTLAWRVNRDNGALLASVRHNGVNNQDIYFGDPVGITHGVTYFNGGFGQGWGYRMNDGVFANGGQGSADLQMGVAGSDEGTGEASFSVAAAFFPYEQGWLGAWVDPAMDEFATFSHASPDVSEDTVRWLPADGTDIFNGVIGRVELPDVNSATDGMLFVAPTGDDNASNIAAGTPRDGGWDVAVREDDDADLTGQTMVDIGQSGFQFLYIPYSAAGLIGAHIRGADGSAINSAGSNRFSVTRLETGKYAASIFDADGQTKKTEDDGMLILSVAGHISDAASLPDRNFLSYEFDTESGRFIIESRELTEQNNFASSQNVFGDVLALRDTDFYFAFVDFRNPFGLGAGVSGDFNGDGLLTADDIDVLSLAVRTGDMNPIFDVNQDGSVTDADRTVWVEQLAKTYFGDSNLDGEFNSSDLVAIFQAGQFEDAVAGNSSWATGDWNGDAEFDTTDFIVAFQAGGFERGPRAAATVPEPAGWLLGLVGSLWIWKKGTSGKRGQVHFS